VGFAALRRRAAWRLRAQSERRTPNKRPPAAALPAAPPSDQTLNQLLTELDGFEGRPGTCAGLARWRGRGRARRPAAPMARPRRDACRRLAWASLRGPPAARTDAALALPRPWPPGVVLLAATNRPEVLDPALMRPG
jgi:SpoVK/Ycf46/Vps4 family AAA+-type ATPase